MVAELGGRVTDSNGMPLEEVFISVSDSRGRKLGETRTGADGHYKLGVEAGDRYEVWAGKTEGYLFHYIPETKIATNLPVDFHLQPGGNIIFVAHDTLGNRLPNGDFRRISGSRVFLTDLADNGGTGTLTAVHSDVSDWQWEKAWPAVVVVPGQRYKILLQWEIPEVGKLLFTLDNGGEGYRVARAGDFLNVNVDREIARSALAELQRNTDVGHSTISIRESRQLLAEGDAALVAMPPDTRAAVRAFGLSVKSSLAANERRVLARAAANIERFRKGDVAVAVMDCTGTPLPGVSVRFEQITNNFMFGAHPLGRNGAYDAPLGALMREAGVNQSYLTARWGRIEGKPDQFNWTNIDHFQDPAAQQRAGFSLVGALGLWLAGNADFWPSFLGPSDFPRLREAVKRYGRALAQHYAESVEIWDLNELNLEGTRFKLDWDQRLQIGREFTAALKAGNPRARVMLSSLAFAHDTPASRSFHQLLQEDLDPDLIGIELYHAGVNAEHVAVNGLDLVAIDRLLDSYASFGKPVIVKEFAVPSVQIATSAWWHRPWDEELQAEYLTGVYSLAFSKRLVRGIVWAWGVSDADAFIMSGGLVDAQLRPKPAYFALQKLLRSWTSHGSVTTGTKGKATWRGFAGTYRVTALRDGREVHSTSLQLVEQQSSQLAFCVDGKPGVH